FRPGIKRCRRVRAVLARQARRRPHRDRAWHGLPAPLTCVSVETHEAGPRPWSGPRFEAGGQSDDAAEAALCADAGLAGDCALTGETGEGALAGEGVLAGESAETA